MTSSKFVSYFFIKPNPISNPTPSLPGYHSSPPPYPLPSTPHPPTLYPRNSHAGYGGLATNHYCNFYLATTTFAVQTLARLLVSEMTSSILATIHSLLITASSSSKLSQDNVFMHDLVKIPDFSPLKKSRSICSLSYACCSKFSAFAMDLLTSILNVSCLVCLWLP